MQRYNSEVNLYIMGFVVTNYHDKYKLPVVLSIVLKNAIFFQRLQLIIHVDL